MAATKALASAVKTPFITPSEIEKFRALVQAGRPDECWPWTGYGHGDGYGALWVPSLRAKVLAHRLAWAVESGRLPSRGECVCHRCDNPICVNPRHLFLGTQQDNIADMVAKGRNYIAPKKIKPPKCIVNSRKTHCPKGHEYNDTNTRYFAGPRGTQRLCRPCQAERAVLVRTKARVARGGPAIIEPSSYCGKGHLLDDANTYVSPSRGRRCRECLRTKTREWMRAQRQSKRAAQC